jgi:hypothetical protein
MSQQINLFNPLFLRQKKYFSAYTMLQGLGIILAVLLVFQGVLTFQLRSLERQKIETQALHAQVQQQLLQSTGSGLGAGSKLQEDERTRVAGMVRDQEEVFKILEGGNFGNGDGYSRFLTALARQRLSGLWLTGFTVSGGGEEMSIRGRVLRADLVPKYIRQLNQQAVMRGHVISELKMVRSEEAVSSIERTGSSPVAAAPRYYIEFALNTTKTSDRPEAHP